MNLVSLLEQRAAEHPDMPALIDTRKGVDRVVSFRELSQRVAAGSAMLEHGGGKELRDAMHVGRGAAVAAAAR